METCAHIKNSNAGPLLEASNRLVVYTHGCAGDGAVLKWLPLVGLDGVGVADPGVLSPGSRGCLVRFIFFS